MADTASKFRGTNDDLVSMLKKLGTELDGLSTQWVGLGANTFQQVRARWEADVAALSQALSETATAVETAGKNYTASDEQAAASANKIGGGLSLPL
jgi:WXG100 family type VII secretion target